MLQKSNAIIYAMYNSCEFCHLICKPLRSEVGTVEFMVAGSLQDPDARFVFMEASALCWICGHPD